MQLYSKNKNYKLYHGNMLDMLEVIEPSSIDSIVTDPPYELNFMSKGWDNAGVSFQADTWKKCYDVLKPGGYLLAFGGTRTFHRIACAIEDAGFEIRDTIMWLYGMGFPKSMDISKSLDKRNKNTKEEYIKFGKWLQEHRENKNLSRLQLGQYCFNFDSKREDAPIRQYETAVNIPTKEIYLIIKEKLNLDDSYDWLIEREEAEREIIGTKKGVGCFNNDEHYTVGGTKANDIDITAPSTDLAKQWQGWGTALKPSFEPIIVARKPFKGSLVDNVIEYGVGGINIDECRVEMQEYDKEEYYNKQKSFENTYQNKESIYEGNSLQKSKTSFYDVDTLTNKTLNNGRFPANTILTYDETPSDERLRYFYCAKASKKDRDEGLDEFEEKLPACMTDFRPTLATNPENWNNGEPVDYVMMRTKPRKNTHPTVKPTELMQYLVRLVTPNGGTVLDPFNGSGSTGKAVMYENKERNKNYKYIGIELTEEYLPIAKARIDYVCNLIEEIEKLKVGVK